jgi:hypothetical protein
MSIQSTWDFARATGGAGAIAEAFFGLDHVVVLDQVHLHADAAMAAELMYMTLNSASGAAYDTVIAQFFTTGVADVAWFTINPIVIAANDELNITCANTNNVTWGLTLVFRHGV